MNTILSRPKRIPKRNIQTIETFYFEHIYLLYNKKKIMKMIYKFLQFHPTPMSFF
jgi:hypothetical protein